VELSGQRESAGISGPSAELTAEAARCKFLSRSETTTQLVQSRFATGAAAPIILCSTCNRRWQPAFLLFLQTFGTALSLQVIQYPHPTLRHRSRPLKRVDAELRKIVEEMIELMYEHEGVGLAANQVDLPYRLFVANEKGDADAREFEQVFINPVLSGGHGQEEDEEGCLSIPGVRAPVVRNAKIRIQGYDLAGSEISREVNGLMARIVQHETDHLDGTLFIDRLGPANLLAFRDQLEEFELAFQSKLDTRELPDAEKMASRLRELERLRT
jgi:peptide deformylase